MAVSRGSAGKGLGDKEARNKFGKTAQVGAQGEQYFANALSRNGIHYDRWMSLHIPNDKYNTSATRYRSDVDIALASGNKLLLIDVKRWASGYHYWSFMGKGMKNFSVMEHSLSANMAAAVNRYSQNLPQVQVKGIVIFVPTGKKGAMPASVRFLKWPGGIKSYQLNDGLAQIQRYLGSQTTTDPKIHALLDSMTRK